jgi:hypothetical protein
MLALSIWIAVICMRMEIRTAMETFLVWDILVTIAKNIKING